MRTKTHTTQRRIGKTTYVVVSGPSEDARDRLEIRINKLLQKDIRQQAQQTNQ